MLQASGEQVLESEGTWHNLALISDMRSSHHANKVWAPILYSFHAEAKPLVWHNQSAVVFALSIFRSLSFFLRYGAMSFTFLNKIPKTLSLSNFNTNQQFFELEN
jgi:hypothetical protein